MVLVDRWETVTGRKTFLLSVAGNASWQGRARVFLCAGMRCLNPVYGFVQQKLRQRLHILNMATILYIERGSFCAKSSIRKANESLFFLARCGALTQFLHRPSFFSSPVWFLTVMQFGGHVEKAVMTWDQCCRASMWVSATQRRVCAAGQSGHRCCSENYKARV